MPRERTCVCVYLLGSSRPARNSSNIYQSCVIEKTGNDRQNTFSSRLQNTFVSRHALAHPQKPGVPRIVPRFCLRILLSLSSIPPLTGSFISISREIHAWRLIAWIEKRVLKRRKRNELNILRTVFGSVVSSNGISVVIRLSECTKLLQLFRIIGICLKFCSGKLRSNVRKYIKYIQSAFNFSSHV